jgi:hypothetical protein
MPRNSSESIDRKGFFGGNAPKFCGKLGHRADSTNF